MPFTNPCLLCACGTGDGALLAVLTVAATEDDRPGDGRREVGAAWPSAPQETRRYHTQRRKTLHMDIVTYHINW